jgi:DNA-binding NtrC family response regulator
MAVEAREYISRDTLMQFVETGRIRNDNIGNAGHSSIDMPYTTALECFEADLLKGLLKRHNGNIDAAAREAGMNMVTMYRKIKKYGIRREDHI